MIESEIIREIDCPRCHSTVWKYVEAKDGRLVIVSPCGWELSEMIPPQDDLDAAMEDEY